jgi:amidase
MNDPDPGSHEIAYLQVGEAQERIRGGTLSVSSWVETLSNRVEAIGNTPFVTNAIAHWERDVELDPQYADGPLAGVPVVIKDSIESQGFPATAGAGALVGRPARDAELVTRLKKAGALVIGSTNLSAWANLRSTHSTSGWSPVGGLVANPWALDRSSGGSSSGCGAALAAGYAPLAVGTETDGSIVCPSSFHGVVGIKPTVGAISRKGVVPISTSQDSPGPMARSVKDVALLLNVLSGSSHDATPTPLRVSVLEWSCGSDKTDALVRDVVAALGKEGHSVTTSSVPAPTGNVWEDELTVLLCEMADELDAYLKERPGSGVSSLAEVIAYEKAHADVELRYFGHELFERALAMGGRAHPDYAGARARNLSWAITECLNPALEGADVVVTSCYAPAWKSDLVLGDPGGMLSSGISSPAGIAGWPIASVPIGLVDGLPVGLAIVGRAGAEESVLRFAASVERLVDLRLVLDNPTWKLPQRG